MDNPITTVNFRQELGGGLLLRWSTAADTEKIGYLMASVHRDSPEAPLRPNVFDEMRILMGGDFPFMTAGDFAVVEDTSQAEAPLVACTCFWRHQWSYAGIPFGVGRPEMVATDPAYRKRGLVRAMFKLVHARSQAEGHLLQAITGISYFYRQFEYEYVLDLGGQRTSYLSLIPAKKSDEPEPYSLRAATSADLPHLMTLYAQGRQRSLLWHEAPQAYWRYLVDYWVTADQLGLDLIPLGMYVRPMLIIAGDGAVCGYITLTVKRWDQAIGVYGLECYPHINWAGLLPTLLRTLRAYGLRLPIAEADAPPFSAIQFELGRAHPVYSVLGEALAPRSQPPYAWYIRIPDVPAFVRHIAPVLDERLAHSLLIGYTGELKIDLYRGGLRLVWEHGKLTLVEPWQAPAYGETADAGCPPLIFLQLLLGYRSLAELCAIFPDVWKKEEAALLINTLFPSQPSTVYALS
jgi:Acetyltransferase (GNAT) domain